jgi:hydroxypyruvate isomerase
MVLAKKWQAAAGKPRGTGAQAQAINPGKAKLIAAVDKKVGENSETIAQKLIDSVKNGDWTGAKLLYAMADGLIDCENKEVVSQLISYAQTLETERQLTDTEAEAAAKREQDEGDPAGLTVQLN